MNTFDGDAMPSRCFAKSTALPMAPAMASLTLPAAPVMPFTMPWMMLLPMFPSVPGMAARPLRSLLPNCEAALTALLANWATQPTTIEMTPDSQEDTLPGSADRKPAIPETKDVPALTAWVAMPVAQPTTDWMTPFSHAAT